MIDELNDDGLGPVKAYKFKKDMLQALEARLNNVGLTKIADDNGVEKARVIEEEMLGMFLDSSLSMLNLLLGFKNPLAMEENKAQKYKDLIIQGALLSALSSHALLERGREFQVSDGDVSFNKEVMICNNTFRGVTTTGAALHLGASQIGASQIGASQIRRSISDLLMQQWELEKYWYMEKVRMIKGDLQK